MTLLEKLAEAMQGKQAIPGYLPTQQLGKLPGMIGEAKTEPKPLTSVLTEKPKAAPSQPQIDQPVSARTAIQTPVSYPMCSVDKPAPVPQKTEKISTIPSNTLAKPFSKMAFARNTGIVDVDDGVFVNDEDAVLLGKLGFDMSVDEYLALEKAGEAMDLYSYIEKEAGIPKAVARAVDKGEAFSGSFLKDMEYSVPKGYEMKGDLCCPIEKEADEKPGLWANIHAKKARGEKPAKPGSEAYPDKEQWKKLTKAAVAQANGAYDRYKKQDYLGSAIDGVGAIGNVAQLAPHPVTKGVGLGVSAASTVANAGRDIHRYNNRPVEFRHDPAILSNPSESNPVQIPSAPLAKSGEATHELKSSNIRAVGYDKKDKALEVAFHSGGEYRYKDVPHSLYNRLLKVKSPGKFFHKHIKKDKPFEYTRVNKENSSTQE